MESTTYLTGNQISWAEPVRFWREGNRKRMLTHHYVLQYHIYTVALHRFLLSRMRNYSYERNFGGVYYLFVRGMKVGTNRGIFNDLPDPETVKVLDKFLVSN